MVAIQYGGVSWMSTLSLPEDVIVQDISKYSTFQGNYGGMLPMLNQCYDVTFDSLIGEFEELWSNLTCCEGGH